MHINNDSIDEESDDDDEDSQSTDEEQQEENGCPTFSKKYIHKMLKDAGNLYYPYPELNDTLWLNHKGFTSIRNMNLFPGLKCLHY